MYFHPREQTKRIRALTAHQRASASRRVDHASKSFTLEMNFRTRQTRQHTSCSVRWEGPLRKADAADPAAHFMAPCPWILVKEDSCKRCAVEITKFFQFNRASLSQFNIDSNLRAIEHGESCACSLCDGNTWRASNAVKKRKSPWGGPRALERERARTSAVAPATAHATQSADQEAQESRRTGDHF